MLHSSFGVGVRPLVDRRKNLSAWLAQRLPLGSFKHDTVISMLAGAGSRLIALASLPLLAHFYAPAELGLWTVVLSVTSYLLAVATMRYDIAVVIAPLDRMARALTIATCLSVGATAALLALAAFGLPASVWQAVSGLPEGSQQPLKLAPLLLILLGLQVMLQAYITRRRHFVTLGISQLLQATITPLASIAILFVAAPSGTTAAIGAMLGLGAANLALLLVAARELKPAANVNWRRIALVTARRYKVYPLFVLPTSLSHSTYDRILQVVLVSCYSLASLGAFAVARQIMMAPAVFLASSLRLTMFAHSARSADRRGHGIRVMRVLRIMIEALAPALAFGLFWLIPLFDRLLPAAWAEVGPYAWWCMLPAAMLFLVSWLDRMLDVLGRQRLSVSLQIASDLALVVLALVGPLLGLSAVGLVALISIAQALYYGGWLAMLLRLLETPWVRIIALGCYAATVLGGWSLAQWLIKASLPPTIGWAAGTLLLASAMAGAVFRVTLAESP